jgi:hypothetical protein
MNKPHACPQGAPPHMQRTRRFGVESGGTLRRCTIPYGYVVRDGRQCRCYGCGCRGHPSWTKSRNKLKGCKKGYGSHYLRSTSWKLWGMGDPLY